VHALYLLSVWLHILAATAWIGGMLFLVLVVVPWLRRGDRASAAAIMSETGRRFRSVGWTCFGILLVTGTFNLWMRGVRFASFAQPEWRASAFGQAVLLKLGTFALVLLLSAVHDFAIGPNATRALERDPRSAQAAALRRRASLLGRANVLLALVLVAAGVVIVRGRAW
jgi:putative copper export protein